MKTNITTKSAASSQNYH